MIELVVTVGGVSHAKLQSNCHHQQNNTQWGTGIRGLMRGMATLPQVTPGAISGQRQKVGRPPGEVGVSKSMECDIFPSVL